MNNNYLHNKQGLSNIFVLFPIAAYARMYLPKKCIDIWLRLQHKDKGAIVINKGFYSNRIVKYIAYFAII